MKTSKASMFNSIFSITLVSSLFLTACGGGSAFNETSGSLNDTEQLVEQPGNNDSSNETTDSANDAIVGLSNEEIAGLLFMREEEELARDLYLDIYEAKDARLNTFKNISDNAETQHAEAIRVLLERYGIEDPSTGSRNTYTDPELQDLYNQLLNIAVGSDDLAALRVGALVEETDIRDINTHKSRVSTQHQDIITTYDNLLCGSRNHLRAFAGQIERITGQAYVTQVAELDAEVQSILDGDRERCGQN